MLADFRHLLRSLRRSPASAAAAIMTLSLTLGAGASIFAVVDAVLLTPPPFADPDALVTVGEVPIDQPLATPRSVGYTTFQAWQQHAGALAKIEGFDATNLTLTELGPAERVSATNITPGFLALLGVAPARGRGFALDDVGRPVVMISHAFWRSRLAGDPDVIGRQLVLGGQAHLIVGVLPERFFFALNACDIWRPLPLTTAQAVRSGYRLRVVARLAGHVTLTDLARSLEDVSARSSPAAHVAGMRIASSVTGGAARTLGLLFGAAAVAVAVAFTNLAGLLIVRSIDRRRELAVRSALGARGWEVGRQLLLESQTLVAMGTVGGVLLAMWLTPAIGRLALEQFGGVAKQEIAVSWRVIAVISLLGCACGAVCGTLPALLAARQNVADALRRGATSAPRELILRRLFVTGVISLAFVLVVSVSLLGRNLVGLLGVNPGFDPRGVLTLQVSLPSAVYTSIDAVTSFYSALQVALEQRLGPRTISIVNEIPLTGDRGRTIVSAAPTDPQLEAVVREAAPHYFDVMRIPLLAGRSFDSGDDGSAPPRVVVSESLARRVFQDGRAAGRRIRLASGVQAEVIGVVGNVKHRALDEPDLPTLYLSALRSLSLSRILVVRSDRPSADVVAVVREELARLDRNLPVYGTRLMIDVVAASPGVPARRMLTAAFAGFALLAVVLAGIGVFGVVAHDVASRQAELALRIALGAAPARIVRVTLTHGASVVGAGVAVGILLSIWVSRALNAAVSSSGQFDVIGAVMALIVLVVVSTAAVVPVARRAARTDPLIVLRSE